jgi:DNA-binding NarL/FixJ family response regulator
MVDDFAPWRHFVIAKLRENRNLRIVGVASDGLGAIQKAGELQPDLILLDIGLPKVTGIVAARRIRNVAPKSKILFLSEAFDLDVAQAALNEGGHGYVVSWTRQSAAHTNFFPCITASTAANSSLSASDLYSCTLLTKYRRVHEKGGTRRSA